MTDTLLLATDLDRTVLPNGDVTEPAGARQRFAAFAERDGVTLAYVSGRGKALLQQAITEYDIPLPAYAIGDVGTTIYRTHDHSWEPLVAWQEHIAADWRGHTHDAVAAMLDDIDELTLQEPEKQNTFKLSYYADEHTDRDALLTRMRSALEPHDIQAALIWSIDEASHTGLMDVLPQSATKLHALEFLMQHLGYTKDNTVFCGDSGNDMPALTSGLNAVLVGNARPEVKAEAQQQAQHLYLAKAPYSAGVLEGVFHFFPECV